MYRRINSHLTFLDEKIRMSLKSLFSEYVTIEGVYLISTGNRVYRGIERCRRITSYRRSSSMHLHLQKEQVRQ